MVEPTARIRPFQAADDKLVRFMIGKANMESLASANRTAYFNPLVVAAWVLLSSVFVQVMKWWPQPESGFMGYLRPIPAFASMAVPIMFFIDWINRPYFEKHTDEILHRVDMADFAAYYSRSPSSGLWILDYGSTFVGLIALDASLTATTNEPLAEQATGRKAKIHAKGTSPTATIRHFYVVENYRSSNIQDDLLSHALSQAFQADSTLQRVQAVDSPLIGYVRHSLRKAGFQLEKHTEKVGVFGWKIGTRVLERKEYGKEKDSVTKD